MERDEQIFLWGEGVGVGLCLRPLVVGIVVSWGMAGCSKQLDDVAMCESAFRYFLDGQADMHFLSAKPNGLSVEVLIKGDEVPIPALSTAPWIGNGR